MAVARHVQDNRVTSDFENSVAQSGAARTVATRSSAEDYSNRVVILGRLKAGRVRESHRLVHVFPVAEIQHSGTVTARCGMRLPVNDLQWLPAVTGMPCEHCLLHILANTR